MINDRLVKTVAFTGGGTLGHLYPALAVIEKLKEEDQNVRIIYLSTPKEKEILINNPLIDQVYELDLVGLKRSFSLKNINLFLKLWKTIRRAKHILKKEKVNLVFGTGGYLSGAVVYASFLAKVPALIHEQNACLGLANRVSMRFVKRILMSFPVYLNNKKVIFTGHPRKDQVKAKYPPKETIGNKILITSGSGGAQKVNEVAIDFLLDEKSHQFDVTLVTGPKYYKEVREKLKDTSNIHFQVVPFIKELPRAMSEVDLVISRAGATTIFELLGLGVPAIYLPSPNVTGNHQEKNAAFLSEQKIGEVIVESELNKEALIKSIIKVMSDKNYSQRLKENTKNFFNINAQAKIVEEIKKWW